MPLEVTATSTVNVYALSDALNGTQTFDTFVLALALLMLGIIFVEKRTLLTLLRTVARPRRSERPLQYHPTHNSHL